MFSRANLNTTMAVIASDLIAETFTTFFPSGELNSTKLDSQQDFNVLYKFFFGLIWNQIWPSWPLICWNISTAPLKPLLENHRNLIGSKISTSTIKFVFFFGLIGNPRWPSWPLIGWDIFDFFSETAAGNSTKLDRKQDLNVLYQVKVFRADWKTKMAVLASDFIAETFSTLTFFFNRWTEFNYTWQEASFQRPLLRLGFFFGMI